MLFYRRFSPFWQSGCHWGGGGGWGGAWSSVFRSLTHRLKRSKKLANLVLRFFFDVQNWNLQYYFRGQVFQMFVWCDATCISKQISLTRLFYAKIDPCLSAFDCQWLDRVVAAACWSKMEQLPEVHAATGRLPLTRPSPGVHGVSPGLGVRSWKFSFPTVSL